MSDDRTILICGICTEVRPRAAGSTSSRCVECEVAVWVSPASKEIRGPGGVTPDIVCTRCARGLIDEESEPVQFMGPTPKQVMEIEKWHQRN